MHDFITQSRPFHGPIVQGPLNDPQDRSVWDVDVAQDIKDSPGEEVAPFYNKLSTQMYTRCFPHMSRLGSAPCLYGLCYIQDPEHYLARILG